jgi:dipeptidyl aminopeptidase/acylaminoacyl peptidase
MSFEDVIGVKHVDDPTISPDGAKVAFTAVDPKSAEKQKEEEAGDDARVIGAGFEWPKLWVIDVETKLVGYPREPHGFREPQHMLDKMKREYAWFEEHVLKKDP